MRRVNFDTQLLRSFLTVADTGSFVAAAEQLNMTQPAMSQQMRRLEEQAGAPLFQRDGRKLSLTSAGETLLRYARRIIALNDRIGEELGSSKADEFVHIGMPEHFSESLLPELIHQAHASFPHLQLTIKIARSQALSDALFEGRLNMALLLGPAPDTGDESCQPVPLRWICGNDFPLPLLQDPVPLVLFRAPCSFRKIATGTLEQAGLSWRCVHEGEDLAILRAAVMARIGITALPMVRDYAGLSFLPCAGKLPSLPNVAFSIKRHPNWKSRSADALATLVETLWKGLDSAPGDANPDRSPFSGRF